MENLFSALSSQSIFNLVIFGILVVLFATVLVMYALWKNGKYSSKGNFFFKLDAVIKQVSPLVKQKYISNPLKKEATFLWIVVLLGVIDAMLSLTISIVAKQFSIDFMLSLFFVVMLVLLTSLDYKYPPVYPNYYEYNPSLSVLSVLYLVIGFVDFVTSLSSGVWLVFLIGFIGFAGKVLLFGLLMLVKHFKREFKPLDLLIYVGALLVIISDSLYFAFFGNFSMVLLIVAASVSLAYSIGVIAVILYVYDKFDFLKKLFGRR